MEEKQKISVTVSNDLLSWIDEQISLKRFANRSHAYEAALFWYKEFLEKGELPPR